MAKRSQTLIWAGIAGLFLLFWSVGGLPTSLWLRHIMGFGDLFDSDEVQNPRLFLLVSESLLISTLVLACACAGLLGYARSSRMWVLRVAAWTCLVAAAQVFTGTVSACLPEHSVFQLINGQWPVDANYAPGFSKWKFANLRTGMHRSEVERRIGRGFLDWTGPIAYGDSIWVYSKPRSENYWMFCVHFTNDMVTHLEMKFWSD